MSAYQVLVAVHGASGVAALATFWTAACARKGGPLHRGAGKVYFLSMLGICATAVPMTASFFARGQPVTATFLGYLVVLVAAGLWLGWHALRLKGDQAAFRGPAYLAILVALLAASGTVLAVGLAKGHPLLIGFSGVGLLSGVQMAMRRARPMQARNWWLQEHYGAMVGLGAATHVAFLGIGLNRLVEAAGWEMPPNFQLVAWFLPVVVSIVAAVLLDRRHKPRPPVPVPATSP
ncbi:hypothetical protein GCM10028862_01930 [Luteimonas pelagia]